MPALIADFETLANKVDILFTNHRPLIIMLEDASIQIKDCIFHSIIKDYNDLKDKYSNITELYHNKIEKYATDYKLIELITHN